MPDRLYEEFFDPTEAFQREPRSFCYDIAQLMITEAKNDNAQTWYTHTKTVQAIVLLLFCWNFAAKITKKITIEGTRGVLAQNETLLKQLEQISFLTFDEQTEPLIRKVFTNFSRAFGQTGATKALSLLNPSLFLMWDTKIRQRLRRSLIRGIDNGQTNDQYLRFMYKVREYSIHYNFQARLDANAVLAKKIDEYHYVRIIME